MIRTELDSKGKCKHNKWRGDCDKTECELNHQRCDFETCDDYEEEE